MALLRDKVVLITGGGGGIGRAEALAFAAEGARVLVADLGAARDGRGSSPEAAPRVAADVRAAGGEAAAHHGTVATAEGARAAVEAAVAAFGRLDVLVNNAGVVRDKGFLKLEEDDWDAVLAVDLKGAFLCAQAAARHMVARGEGGRIVNTTGLAGLVGNFGQANYAAANAGVFGLTRTMSIELQKHRITVNALAPIAKTRLTEDLPMFHGVDSLGPEFVAPAAVFLGSDLCGERTGHVLAVAGARTYLYKVVESPGRFKEGNEPWTPHEIAENWDAIASVKG
jgi:NAD(P)-dependent dehydrogenase (short-subunit alcohol dehydrogenase family)